MKRRRKINRTTQKYLILQTINSKPNKVINQDELSSNTKITLQTMQSQISAINRNEGIYKDFRVGDIKHSLADISKAKKLLGYAPKYTIEKGLNKYIGWYNEK